MNWHPVKPALLSRPAARPSLWPLDPGIVFLNHGSFGACPRPVLARQDQWRARMEAQPLQFFGREVEGCLDEALAALGRFLGAQPADLAVMTNATTGVNTVLRSLPLRAGDELLVTNQEYNASRNALNHAAELAGARVVVAEIPFAFRDAGELIDPILNAVTRRTRLVLLDHVTSQTALLMPVETLVRELDRRGIDTLVDGAHAPGMVPLDLDRLGAAYYTGNCHKWLCAPKGAAFLHVRRDRQKLIRPLTISHGANSPRRDRSRFRLEFGWQGTFDASAFLSVPEAIRFLGAQLPGGWPEVMARNRALALAARRRLSAALDAPDLIPDAFIGSMAIIPLPDAPPDAPPQLPCNLYPLQDALLERHHIEAPVVPWPRSPKRLLRVAAQLYNSLPQYETLAQALAEELKREKRRKKPTQKPR